MAHFALGFVAYFIVYLVLTIESGHSFWLWNGYELLLSLIISLLAAVSMVWIVESKKSWSRMWNPIRWLKFIVYLIGPFFFAMLKANLDVAYRVITGKINPGIVKISPGFKTDLATTMLANSITLTPGTLSVDVDEESNDLYVHWINVTTKEPKIEDVCGSFPKWAGAVAE